jgi:hypothetical protein
LVWSESGPIFFPLFLPYLNDNYSSDNNKLVFKEKTSDIVKYIGKFNSNLKYEDDCGTYYSGPNLYTGKFIDGKFISGTFHFPGGVYTGSFNDFVFDGKGVITFNTGSSFTGIFENNTSDNGIYKFKYNGIFATLSCGIKLSKNVFIFESKSNSFLEIGNSKYEGRFNISKNETEEIKFIFNNGKHYINDVLIYDGDFKNLIYSGSGMKFHSNTLIQFTGIFENGEPYKGEYYDEAGDLIYVDDDIDYTNNNQLPPLVSLNQTIGAANLINLLNMNPSQPIETNMLAMITNAVNQFEEIINNNGLNPQNNNVLNPEDDNGTENNNN